MFRLKMIILSGTDFRNRLVRAMIHYNSSFNPEEVNLRKGHVEIVIHSNVFLCASINN